ncbi:MAG: hypothetical protein KC636_36195 [Myxococcales bacterium]|nr:hypothetical protein [Myxococcales bacterium]
MQSSDKLESYMLRMDLPHEPIAGSENTWLVAPENLRHSAIVVRAEDPIVVFTAPVFEVRETTPNREALYRELLVLNEELLHAAYGLQGKQIVLSGALQMENLDFAEFQAMIDDMTLSLDIHLDRLAPWRPENSQEAS